MNIRCLAASRRYATTLSAFLLAAGVFSSVIGCGNEGTTESNAAVEEELQGVLDRAIANPDLSLPGAVLQCS